jgi:hypothetical protein
MRMPFLSGVLIAVTATATAGCASAGTGASTTAASARATSPGTSPASAASPASMSPGTSPASAASTSPGSSPASPLPGSPGCARRYGAPPVPGTSDHVLTLTSAQDGKAYCVTAGTSVLVVLKGTPADKWGLIRASGRALRPSANGRMTLMIGVTGASFLAVHPGTSVISSTRPVCASSATPADVPCAAVGTFRVTVTVLAS